MSFSLLKMASYFHCQAILLDMQVIAGVTEITYYQLQIVVFLFTCRVAFGYRRRVYFSRFFPSTADLQLLRMIFYLNLLYQT